MKDTALALQLFRKAAEQGYVPAEVDLGVTYEHGVGTPQDYAQALTWYGKAANQGQPNAQYNMGWMYKAGRGVAVDGVQALMWFNLTAANPELASAGLGQVLSDAISSTKASLTPAQIAEADRLAKARRPQSP